MTVLCAIPLQIPVHRIRVTAQCLATGGPVHTAALRLADFWGESPEEIAEVLGLAIPTTEQLLHDLENGGEPIERDFVLWVDHARERVLPYSALSGVAVKPSKYGPFTLPVDPPTPNRLRDMGLDAGMSWDLGLEGHVEVLDVLDVIADIRDRTLPHVLRLPDTQLVISTTAPPSERAATAPPSERAATEHAAEHAPSAEHSEFECSVAQHGTIDPHLTSWARGNYAEDLAKLTASAELDVTDRQLDDLAALTKQGHWQTLQPHPGILRDHIADAAHSAQERLVIGAPDLRYLPTWLEELIGDTADRDVQIVLCPTKPDQTPARAPFEFTASPTPRAPDRHPETLTILADETCAVTHTDPAAFLDRRTKPTRQYAYRTRHAEAIAGLLDRLGLKRLRPRAPRRQLSSRTIAAMLRAALADLQRELPKTVTATIQPEDESFAQETLARQRTPENPTAQARRAAAGIAWERVLTALANHLATEHDHLHVLAERWKPPEARIDLDLILADEQKDITWIIDAKNATPTNDQLHKMQAQLRLLRHAPELTGERPAIGVIVHHKRQLDPPLQPTEHPNILRCTVQRLPDLLLAKRLPGDRLTRA